MLLPSVPDQRKVGQTIKGSTNIRHCRYFVIVYSELVCFRASLLALSVKNLPAMLETRVRSLGWKDPLEKCVLMEATIGGLRGVVFSSDLSTIALRAATSVPVCEKQ